MSGIEELQRRVVEAEERFGLIAEQRARYSERLTDLIDAIEGRLNDQQSEIARQAAEIASQSEELTARRHESAENKLLRGMLHTLLSAIEAGGRDTLSETMLAMEAKISALLAGSAPAMPALEAAPAVAEEWIAEPDAPEAEPGPTEEPGEPGEAVLEEEDLGPDPEAARAILSALDPPNPAEPDPAEPAEDGGESPDASDIAAELAAEMAAEFEAPDDADVTAALDQPEAGAPEAGAPEGGAPEGGAPGAGDPETETRQAPQVDEPDEAPLAAEQLGEAPLAEDGPAPQVLEIPVGDADVNLIDDELMIGAPELEFSGENAAPAPAEGLENLIDDEVAAPDIPAVADGPDAKPETATLEDIMRRVSKLVEEEGALGPLSGGGVSIGAGIAAGAQDRDAPPSEPATVRKTASKG